MENTSKKGTVSKKTWELQIYCGGYLAAKGKCESQYLCEYNLALYKGIDIDKNENVFDELRRKITYRKGNCGSIIGKYAEDLGIITATIIKTGN